MKKDKSAAAFFALTSLAAQALAGPAPGTQPTPRDLHAARCVAALEVLTQELAHDVKAGDDAARTVLMDRLVAGAAFIGEAWLRGTSDEEQARAARQRAMEAQKALPPAELAARQEACAREGASLYASANGLQRYAVRRAAQRRMDKLLGGEPPRRARGAAVTEGPKT